MFQTLIRNWWLLALCGVLEAIYAVMNLVGRDADGSLIVPGLASPSTMALISKLALAAGVSTAAAGIWSSGKGRSWLLVVNGMALIVYGVAGISPPRGRVGFLPVALLFVVMAVSAGVFAFAAARTLGRHVADRWFLGLAGSFSTVFAFGFLVFGLRWIRLEPLEYVLWMSSYFGFSAICMLALGLRLNSLRAAVHRMAAGVPAAS